MGCFATADLKVNAVAWKKGLLVVVGVASGRESGTRKVRKPVSDVRKLQFRSD